MIAATQGSVQSRISTGALLTLAVVVLVGFATGFVKWPVLYLTTALFGVLFWRNAQSRQTKASHPEGVAPEFPKRLQARAALTLRFLEEGEARHLLLLVIEQARPIYEYESGAFDDAVEAATRLDCDDLLDVCCGIALDLERLDRANAARSAGSRQATGDDDSYSARFQAARKLLAQCLSDAESAFRGLYVATLEGGSKDAARVGELAAHLKADAAARQAALGDLGAISPDANDGPDALPPSR